MPPHKNTQTPPVLLPGNTVLRCVTGPEQGQQLPVTKSPFIFGRGNECDVIIATSLVSRQHAVLTYEQGHYVLYDQNSTNGTWVNGQRILQHVVKNLDRVQIGPNVYVLQQPPQTNSPRTPPPGPMGQKQTALVAGIPTQTLEDYE